MDRYEAMRVFVAVLDEGSLTKAAHKLGKSSAAVSRALADLESQVGVELVYRTTRSIRLSDAGELYVPACRSILNALEDADNLAAVGRSEPRGLLTITAPVAAGDQVVCSLISKFRALYPAVCVRLHLLDRMANLVDEGIDLALRIAHLPDSSLTGTRLGDVRRVLAASPSYLANNGTPTEPSDLTVHNIIAMTHFGIDSWSFPPTPGSSVTRQVQFQPRFIVNSIRSAVNSAVSGGGIVRLFSYHIADEVKRGDLEIILPETESPRLPVHLVAPEGRLQIPKVRAFVDFATPRLRRFFRREAFSGQPVDQDD